MRVSIIVDDNMVLVEGMPNAVDCSALIPQGVHAVQWYGAFGEVEFVADFETGSRKPNERFTDLSPFQSLIDVWMVEAQKPAPKAPAQTKPEL